MGGSATPDRDRLLGFELALDEKVCDEVRQESWGRLFLTPSTHLIWDANWVAIEETGLSVERIVAIADEALGGEGFGHRTVCPLDQADGRRIGKLIEAEPGRWPGWEIELARYMVWRGEQLDPALAGGSADLEAREVPLAAIEELRRRVIEEETTPTGVPEPEATVDQLFEIDQRYGVAGGDRWFAAPGDDPRSCCRLLSDGTIGQVEDVATREDSRERGYAKAVVTAAVAAAQADGDVPIFLIADAADWPQLMYAKLGFETVGDLTILRRRP